MVKKSTKPGWISFSLEARITSQTLGKNPIGFAVCRAFCHRGCATWQGELRACVWGREAWAEAEAESSGESSYKAWAGSPGNNRWSEKARRLDEEREDPFAIFLASGNDCSLIPGLHVGTGKFCIFCRKLKLCFLQTQRVCRLWDPEEWANTLPPSLTVKWKPQNRRESPQQRASLLFCHYREGRSLPWH